jgi:hypothetical protein
VAKSSRAYKSAKRGKELQRLQKREEKRLRRLNKAKSPEEEGQAPAPSDETPPADSEESK